MQYYIVDDYNNLNQAMKQMHPFIEATDTQLLYITKNPVFSSDISLATIICDDDKLIYQEEPLFQKMDFLAPKMAEDSPKKIFFDDLVHCGLHYQFGRDGELPRSVTVELKTQYDDIVYTTAIQSDFNSSTYLIERKVYDEE